ncbi:hypothetical protein J4H65_04505 [Vibrio alginolyticus]|uniref:hypothetical protein n=1 Tax=Vibrio alginolyticus TaxID=663 RepID=UPI001BD245F5|nr:hypothetical protein [Vibrio alginolyticus]MBT0074534.1 hypothetical protein [Vibrio alginolyticus]
MDKEKPISSIPDVLEKDAYQPDIGEQVEIEQDIVFVGTFNDMLRKHGSAEQSRGKKRWQNH